MGEGGRARSVCLLAIGGGPGPGGEEGDRPLSFCAPQPTHLLLLPPFLPGMSSVASRP